MATFDLNAVLSSTAYDAQGDRIGKVEQVFLDDNTGEPTFLTVNTGLFGAKENFVPVKGMRQDGDRVELPYTKDVIKDAPKVDADDHLSPAEEDELYRYYEMNQGVVDADRRRDVDAAAAGTAGVAGAATDGRLDRDNDRLADEDAVVRHEERVRVGTEERATGQARLRKYVVTENETVEVPVRREKVTLDRTPIADGEGRVADGGIGEEEIEVTLHEERPVVAKETVAVEKVALGTETVETTERVETEVRKEQVDFDTDETARRNDGLGEPRI